MEDKMRNYLENQLFSERFKEIILTLILKKKSIVAICLNQVLQNIENNYMPLHEEFKKVSSLRMLDFRKDNDSYVISYLALGKEPEFTANDKWTRKNRQQGKVGKTIKTFLSNYLPLLQISLTDADIEVFVNDTKSLLSNKYIEFKLVKGMDIAKYYYYENYAHFSDSNTLHNSCMKYERCQSFFDIYTENPDCELLIMFDKSTSEELIVARALVWNKDGQKYVDRRYYMLDMYHTAMIDYIKSQKWGYKAHNTFDDSISKIFCVYDDSTESYVEKDIVLSYTYKEDISIFPYSDTVKYYQNKFLTNDLDSLDKGEYYTLCDTDGEYESSYDDDDDEDMVYCSICDSRVHIDDASYIESIGEYVCDCHCEYDTVLQENILASEGVWIRTFNDHLFCHESILEECIKYNEEYYINPGNSYDLQSCIIHIDEGDNVDMAEFLENGYEVITDGILIKPYGN